MQRLKVFVLNCIYVRAADLTTYTTEVFTTKKKAIKRLNKAYEQWCKEYDDEHGDTMMTDDYPVIRSIHRTRQHKHYINDRGDEIIFKISEKELEIK